jgi:hypothetical protein
VLRDHEEHVDARLYRALLRKQIGDETGSACDLRRVLELAPEHAAALDHLSSLGPKPGSDVEKSLFGGVSEG